jgi:hypothetical protein
MGTFSLQQAAASSPELARVAERIRQSGAMLRAVLPLIPPPMQAHVTPGPVDDAEWCLLVPNVAMASKLRQLGPLLTQHLQQQGIPLRRLRIKVRTP